jgi:ribokinase
MSIEVIGIGSLNYDYIYQVDTLAAGDSQVVVNSTHGAPGGSAANTIHGLASLDISSGFLGAVGSDGEGEKIVEQMTELRIDCSRVQKVPGEQTAKVLVFVDAAGERAMYSVPGANVLLNPTDDDVSWLSQSKYVIISAIPGDDQLLKIQRVVEQISNKTRIVFMPGALYTKLGYSRLQDIINRSFLLVLNRREIRELTDKDNEYREGVRWLLDHGAQRIAVTLGDIGCMVVDGAADNVVDDLDKFIIRTPELSKNKIIDTTGAGDAFAAGFVFGLLHGKDLNAAGLLGNLTARACIQGLGARQGCIGRTELLDQFETHSKEILHEQ